MSPTGVATDGLAVVGRIRLLLVDADPAERARLRADLEPRFAVTEAANADEAVGFLGTQYFEAILTDYELGPKDGAWLLEYVFAHHEHVLRALMSVGGVEELTELRRRGVVWLFKAKPVDAANFSRYFAQPWETPGAG